MIGRERRGVPENHRKPRRGAPSRKLDTGNACNTIARRLRLQFRKHGSAFPANLLGVRMMYSFGIRHRQPWLVLSAQPDLTSFEIRLRAEGQDWSSLFRFLRFRRFCAGLVFRRASSSWLRNKRLDLGAQNKSAARHARGCQAAPADQICNGLLGHASNARSLDLRDIVL